MPNVDAGKRSARGTDAGSPRYGPRAWPAVLVAGCAPDASQWRVVADVCETCGATAHPLSCIDGLDNAAYAAAIVALRDAPDDALETIERLHAVGAEVIAHASGVGAWHVRARCQVLLAGARHVLDSDSPTFADQLEATLRGVLCALAQRREEAHELRALACEHGIVGCSASLLDSFRQLLRTARLSDLPVLITGESGTGKELFAGALHALDPKRSQRPLVAVNCAAISVGVAETELFGHVRGAFTGAAHDHRGLFLSAQGGVLFLDEVGELDLDVQAKLLRVLQEKRVSRVGAEQELAVDIRVVAATNQDLARMVEQGRFRADLFHRLSTLSIHIAPLRERAADVRPLVEHFLRERVGDGDAIDADCDVIDALAGLTLEGNVRELRNLVLSALAAKVDPGPLHLQDLPPRVWQELSAPSLPHATPDADPQDAATSHDTAQAASRASLVLDITRGAGWNLSRCLAQCEREFVRAAMQRTRNNQSQAARLLGVTPRSIYNKLRRHQLLAGSLD